MNESIKYKEYSFFAKYYDEIMENVGYEIWADELSFIIDKYAPSLPTILYLGCGTGYLMFYLINKGYNIDGVDISSEMLEIAKKRCPKNTFFTMDIKSLNINKKYDLIFSVNDTFNYFLKEDELLEALININRHLLNKGFFFLEMGTLKNILSRFYKKEIQYKLRDRAVFTMTTELNFDTDICTSHLYFKTKNTLPIVEIHKQRIYSKDKTIYLLDKAGFEIIGIFGGTNMKPYIDGESLELLFIAKKKD